jgi:hypothetical protein
MGDIHMGTDMGHGHGLCIDNRVLTYSSLVVIVRTS